MVSWDTYLPIEAWPNSWSWSTGPTYRNREIAPPVCGSKVGQLAAVAGEHAELGGFALLRPGDRGVNQRGPNETIRNARPPADRLAPPAVLESNTQQRR